MGVSLLVTLEVSFKEARGVDLLVVQSGSFRGCDSSCQWEVPLTLGRGRLNAARFLYLLGQTNNLPSHGFARDCFEDIFRVESDLETCADDFSRTKCWNCLRIRSEILLFWKRRSKFLAANSKKFTFLTIFESFFSFLKFPIPHLPISFFHGEWGAGNGLGNPGNFPRIPELDKPN